MHDAAKRASMELPGAPGEHGAVASKALRAKRSLLLGSTAMAAAGVLALAPVHDAWAACQRPSGAGASVFDFIPLASGATVSSIIATIGAVNTASLAQSSAYVGAPGGAKPDQQGGGSWSRVIVGEVETEANTRVIAVVPIAAEDACRSTTRHEYYGTQAGLDIARLNFAGGGNLHVGVTTGYFNVRSKDRTVGLGQFSSEADIPFVGAYISFASGAFSFDAQARGDYYQMAFDDIDQGMIKQDVTGRGITFLFNAAYRFDLPSNWFVETSVGGVSSRTDIDAFGVTGGFNVPAALTPSLTLPGTIKIDEINSLLGRVSVRVGTSFTSGNILLVPFATVSVFREFAGNVRTTMSTFDPGFALEATSFTDRVGTFGHLGVGIAGTVLDTGWLGYARLDYRTGDKIEGLSFNAGLRHQFQPPREAASLKDDHHHYGGYAPFSWTGFYAGWSSGSLWGQEEWLYTAGFIPGERVNPTMQGYTVGGQLGYNYQIGHTVLGVEVDYSWSNAKGGRTCPGAVANFLTCVAEIDSIGFFTGRLGYARDRALFFVRGGLAVADVSARERDILGSVVPPDLTAGGSATSWGWAFGAGLEFAITDRWSVKGEWMHFDLGKENFTVALGDTIRVHTHGDVARIGINYHFGQH